MVQVLSWVYSWLSKPVEWLLGGLNTVGANNLGVCFLVLFVPLCAFGMLLGRKGTVPSKKMYRVRPFATSLKHGHMVNKLSCLLTPRTPAPYKVYAGEVGFYINDRMYGVYHVCFVLISQRVICSFLTQPTNLSIKPLGVLQNFLLRSCQSITTYHQGQKN